MDRLQIEFERYNSIVKRGLNVSDINGAISKRKIKVWGFNFIEIWEIFRVLRTNRWI